MSQVHNIVSETPADEVFSYRGARTTAKLMLTAFERSLDPAVTDGRWPRNSEFQLRVRGLPYGLERARLIFMIKRVFRGVLPIRVVLVTPELCGPGRIRVFAERTSRKAPASVRNSL